MSSDKIHHSTSFSSPKDDLKLKKAFSYSAEKDEASMKKIQKEPTEKDVIEKVIEKLNSIETNTKWQLLGFEQKRVISGFKGRVKWKSLKSGIEITLKISFASTYFRSMNNIGQGDIVSELQEINFQSNSCELREMQQKIENILYFCYESIRKRNYTQEIKKQSEYLKLFLFELDKYFQNKETDKKPKPDSERIDKKNISKRYMLYPSPATFTWNPLGGICITENKFPLNRRQFIGDPNSLKKYLDNSKIDSFNILKEETELNLEGSKQKENNIESIYGWDLNEEIAFTFLNREKLSSEKGSYYKSKEKMEMKEQQRNVDKLKDEDSVPLSYSLRIQTTKMRKIYERYFFAYERNYQFNIYDKLKVYQVINSNRVYEDEIVYLIEKINLERDKKSITSVALSCEFSLYKELIESDHISKFKYGLIADHLRFKLTLPLDSFSIFLKIFIIQNQYFACEYTKYLKLLFASIKAEPIEKIYFLASYNHFDQHKSETLFLNLLSKYQQIQESDQNLREISPKTITDNYKIKSFLKIKQKWKIPKFSIDWVTSEADKNNFLMTLFPLLIVKDRQVERFEYKQIKRIITANSKIMNFVRKVNDILGKLEENKLPFIHHILQSHQRFQDKYKKNHHKNIQPRRLFHLYCKFCNKPTTTFELSEIDSNEACIHCNHLRSNV